MDLIIDSIKQLMKTIYVDGLSITHNSNPREHIWTFAGGFSENITSLSYNCPCAVYPGNRPLSVVGNNFYCESASVNHPDVDT